MFAGIQKNVQKDIKNLKRKYRILKIKWILLFVLPILVIVLAYHVSKQFLKLKIQDLGTKVTSGEQKKTKENKKTEENKMPQTLDLEV